MVGGQHHFRAIDNWSKAAVLDYWVGRCEAGMRAKYCCALRLVSGVRSAGEGWARIG